MNKRIIEIYYINHKGNRRLRKILPTGSLTFMSTQWDPVPQWLFTAIDLEDGLETVKHFALEGIVSAVNDAETREKAGLDQIGKLKAQLAIAEAFRNRLCDFLDIGWDTEDDPLMALINDLNEGTLELVDLKRQVLDKLNALEEPVKAS